MTNTVRIWARKSFCWLSFCISISASFRECWRLRKTGFGTKNSLHQHNIRNNQNSKFPYALTSTSNNSTLKITVAYCLDVFAYHQSWKLTSRFSFLLLVDQVVPKFQHGVSAAQMWRLKVCSRTVNLSYASRIKTRRGIAVAPNDRHFVFIFSNCYQKTHLTSWLRQGTLFSTVTSLLSSYTWRSPHERFIV